MLHIRSHFSPRWARLLPAALLCLVLSACAADPAPAEQAAEPATPAVVLSAEQAQQRLDSGDAVIAVDVRPAEDYAQAHLPGAISLPLEQLDALAAERLPVRDAELLLYGAAGSAAQAVAALDALGYTQLADIGDLADWPGETLSGGWADKQGTFASFRSCDLYGQSVDESVLADSRLTMINIWGTYCNPCLSEMPELAQLNADYADQGFQVIGVVIDMYNQNGVISLSQVGLARELATETGADYLHLLPMADLQSAALDQINAVPTTYFVNSSGEILGEPLVGARSGADWAAIVDELLAGL